MSARVAASSALMPSIGSPFHTTSSAMASRIATCSFRLIRSPWASEANDQSMGMWSCQPRLES